MSAQRYCFRQDDSAHWYCIKVEDVARFDELLAKVEEDYGEAFNETFDLYRMDYHLSTCTFTDPRVRVRKAQP